MVTVIQFGSLASSQSAFFIDLVHQFDNEYALESC